MKTWIHKIIIIFILGGISNLSHAQGPFCTSAEPFCSNDPFVSFQAGTGLNTLGAMGCLNNTPNAAWYYMQVNNPGRINIEMWTSPSRDLDFIIWGPFTAATIGELNSNCTSLDEDCSVACGSSCFSHGPGEGVNPVDLGGYPCGNIIDCSYSYSTTEYVHIPDAQPGQWYILLITNYSNQNCEIIFNSHSTSAGSTNCGILVDAEAIGDEVCIGETATLASAVIMPPDYIYTWSGPNGFHQSGPSHSITIPNASISDAGYYTMTFYNVDTISQPATCLLQVNPKPEISFITNPIYPGEEAIVTAVGAETYLWSTGFAGNPLLVSPPASTMYRVTGTSIHNCIDSAQVMVKVTDAPMIIKNPDEIHVCQGAMVSATINFYHSLPSCSNHTQYRIKNGTHWSNWTNYNSGANLFTNTFSEIQIRAYQLGCNNGGLIINSDTSQVNWIIHPPISRESLIRNPEEDGICLGAEISLTTLVPTDYPFDIEYQYQAPTQIGWTSGNSFTPTEQGMAWIRVRATTTAFGCTSMDWEWFAWMVQPQPEIFGLTDQTICRGGETQFEANVIDGYGENTFRWQRAFGSCNGNWQNISSSDTSIYNAGGGFMTGTRYYRAIVTQTGYNCSDTSQCVTLTSVQPPVINISGDTVICESEDININALINGGSGSNSIKWFIRANSSDPWTLYSETTDTLVTITNVDQSFQIRAELTQTSDACEDISNIWFVRVMKKISIIQQPIDAQACIDQPLTIRVIANGELPILYQWHGPNGIITGETNSEYHIPQVAWADTGAYYCEMTNACNTITSTIANITIGDLYQAATTIEGISNRCAGAGWNMFEAITVNETSRTWELHPSEAGTMDANSGLVTWNPGFTGDASILFIATGCGNTDTLSHSVSVLLPVVDPTIIWGDSIRCQGFGTSQYTSNAENVISYVWSLINAGNSTINPSTGLVSWDPNFNGDAVVSVFAIGCNGTSAVINKGIKINDFPPISSLGSVEICLGEPAYFSVLLDTITAFNFQWFGPQGEIIGATDTNLFIPMTTLADSGIYYCRITTYCGYSYSPNDTLIIHHQPNPAFVVEPSCMSEFVNFANTSSADDMPLTVLWNFGDGQFSNSYHPQHQFDTHGDFEITLVIQSSFGCIDSTTQTLEIFEKPFFTISNENIRCYGLSDASISIEVTGGNAPYSYILNNGNPQDTNYFEGLSSGIYHVGVYDNNLCYYSDSVTITQPHLLTSNYTISNVLCHNDTSGTIHTNVFGGTPPYSFVWSDGQTDSMIFVPTGSYDVVISDANGCTTIHSGISIWQPNPIVIDSIVKQRSCELVNDGMIAVYPSGGYGSYHFLWSNLSTNDTIMNLTSGNYIITVSDDNNCEYIREFEILPNSDQCWEIWTSFSPNGDGINDNWNIHFSHLYPKISVQVFNRWGALIYESIGNYKPWDGSGPGGQLVPPATYYFVVDLKDEITKPITGNVTVIY